MEILEMRQKWSGLEMQKTAAIFDQAQYESYVDASLSVELQSCLLELVFGKNPEARDDYPPRASENLGRALKKLPPREGHMLILRFQRSDDGQLKSYREIGEMFGLSRSRVGPLIHKALRTLRHPSAGLTS